MSSEEQWRRNTNPNQYNLGTLVALIAVSLLITGIAAWTWMGILIMKAIFE